MTATPSRDEGMTLVELIIAITVLVLVVTPLTMVLSYALSASSAASQLTTDSSGAQLMSSYFVTDVQGADFVWTSSKHTDFGTAPFTTATSQCGTNANTVLELQNQDAVTGAIDSVTYDLSPASGPDDNTALVRKTWTATSSSCTPVDSTRLIDAVDASNPPTVVCDPVDCVSPNDVQITVRALSQNVHNSGLYNVAYSYTLAASRRVG